MNKKIVFVCHYFPPETNVGIRRILFWANYLSDKGFPVLVITTKKANSSSMFEVLSDKVEVVEYGFFGASKVTKILKSRGDEDTVNRNVRENKLIKLLTFIKRNVINRYIGQIVDSRLINVFGFIISLFFGRHKDVLDKNSLIKGVLISTSPPWPMHVLGAFLSKKYEMDFYADYRDPFSNNHIFSNNLHKIEEQIERIILRNAKGVFSVSNAWVDYYKEYHSNVLLLRNGYNELMFSSDAKYDNKISSTIDLNYFGSIEHKERIPKILIEYVNRTKLDINLNFYGSCNLLAKYLNDHDLTKNVKIMGTLPYGAAIEKMKSSDINVVCESMNGKTSSHRGLIPTKIYEYMAAKRPILALVSSDSEIYPMIRESGLLINEPIIIFEDIEQYILKYKTIELTPNVDYIKDLSRQVVAEKLIELINEH